MTSLYIWWSLSYILMKKILFIIIAVISSIEILADQNNLFSKKNNQILSGKINSGQITHIDKGDLNFGDFVKVKIIDSTPFYLKAEQI